MTNLNYYLFIYFEYFIRTFIIIFKIFNILHSIENSIST